MRAAEAVTPNLAYPPEGRLPTTDIKPLARSKCRRRRRGAPPYRRHARGGGRFPVPLPLRARNRSWFGPTNSVRGAALQSLPIHCHTALRGGPKRGDHSGSLIGPSAVLWPAVAVRPMAVLESVGSAGPGGSTDLDSAAHRVVALSAVTGQ
jgi:hypothetical protein